MTIDDYSFGRVVINGKDYDSDVLIFPDGRIDDTWWREEGHVLTLADIEELLEAKPKLIIAGTGAYGEMKPTRDLEQRLSQHGVSFKAVNTTDAVKTFNELSDRTDVAACLHLTC